jgi:DNA-binding transcriptional regulator YhcF (GntR family)
MIYGLGPRARRVYASVRDRIARGDWTPGMRLPSHRELAIEFGVAPLTVRQVLGQLESEGLVSREVGRGTFVRERSGPSILVVEDDATMAAFLADYVGRAGFQARIAHGLDDARATLSTDLAVVLALCDLRVPTAGQGVALIRALRSDWPHLPLAVLVAELGDLEPLFGTPAWPLHILSTPVNLGELDELLRLVPRRAPTPD